ncbi:type ISP restriction/modification enzyme [Pararhizobium sp. DWP1-1-3]|uniref:type ISP restriction/modification enzyme n=1 Tax=Pararhizobium sp. DWP1-1-3 TaxID=2804652 RepID=UPI003CF417A5
MSQILINAYLNDLERYKKFSGSATEGIISEAFKDLLKAWARSSNLHFINQYEFQSTQKNRIRPDGTILHYLRVPLGYWEAKDSGDDLDAEIAKKLAKGYPQDNIIFEDSRVAVLIQNRQEVMRCPMTEPALLKLLNLFFSYERAEIRDFRKAVEQFKADIPAVLKALREKIDTAYAGNPGFQAAANKFLEHARDTINPAVGEADVREMLIQHILTEEIFAHVFDQGDFHRENNIAKELYALEGKFFTGQIKRETLKGLETYYATIRANAALITSHSEKQAFLKVIYENFYKVYDKKKADRLGVVYTPNEIVKFMIEGADWLCEKHFSKNLIDEHVEILDPATGTGTFICQFAEYPNLCFVDTLDNVAGLGIKAGFQHDMFAGLSDENVARVKRQNARKISVIIGNPPYNANQANENDNNKNRDYPRIDELIKSSYIRLSTAQKTKVYDMYARFFRWASDRMHDDGVLAFITNRSFIDSRTFDGFRRAVEGEFAEIHIVDLGGDVRANPKLSGTKNNVFGIQTGVAIAFFVKRRKQKGCKIFYARRPEMDTADDKLAFLASAKLSSMAFERIVPDKNANWFGTGDFEAMISLADKNVKAGRSRSAIFRLFSWGNSSNRDEWVYDVDAKTQLAKADHMIHAYNRQMAGTNPAYSDTVKWSENLKRHFKGGKRSAFNEKFLVSAHWRPFSKTFLYADRLYNDRLTENHVAAFGVALDKSNEVLMVCGHPQIPFTVHAVSGLPDAGYASRATQMFPRFKYLVDGERIDNITDWGLKQFQKAYGKNGSGLISPLEGEMSAGPTEGGETASSEFAAIPPSAPIGASPPQGGRSAARSVPITKDDIFHYVYGVLHDPVYRETYAQNLKREFPRIPFYPDFFAWAGWGKRLMELHIGYETVEPWPLLRLDTPDKKAREAGVAPKAVLKADKDNGIIRLDSETTLSGIPPEVWSYRLGNRSGLEWILDQYKEKTPKDPTIREKFNIYRFADYKEHVIDLIARVTRVSVETVDITEAMKSAKR